MVHWIWNLTILVYSLIIKAYLNLRWGLFQFQILRWSRCLFLVFLVCKLFSSLGFCNGIDSYYLKVCTWLGTERFAFKCWVGVWIKAVFRQSTAAHKTSNHCLFSIPPESPSVEKVALNFWAQPLLTQSAAPYGKSYLSPWLIGMLELVLWVTLSSHTVSCSLRGVNGYHPMVFSLKCYLLSKFATTLM